MAKLSCSYFLVLMIVFSVCLMVEKTEGKELIKKETTDAGKVCVTTIKEGLDCIKFFCDHDCAAQHKGGLGYCEDDPKVPGPLNCRCAYPC
ncbi:defensin-like protein 159 [Raphanus sativus]|uniref:Defensin-like protein 159 n=1 Tax=Raphanus sativus TaxID=3726 RepID=A0A9W3CBG4_RAPSA|nr:defensin-like protein 159 [Raphanus sativus]